MRQVFAGRGTLGKLGQPSEIRSGDRSAGNLADLFVPETVLPVQFFSGIVRGTRNAGEKALILAVLEDGIRCFQEHLRNPRSHPRLLSQEADAWIRAVDYEWFFSFNNVCESLDIDPVALRAALLAWKAKYVADGGARGLPMLASKKVYRLHLRNKRPTRIR